MNQDAFFTFQGGLTPERPGDQQTARWAGSFPGSLEGVRVLDTGCGPARAIAELGAAAPAEVSGEAEREATVWRIVGEALRSLMVVARLA